MIECSFEKTEKLPNGGFRYTKCVDNAKVCINGKWLCYHCVYKELQTKNEQLKELLIEYGRHQPGCSAQYNKKYPCRCGWNRESKRVLGKEND